ncbi:MAG: hypothetical protein AB1772_06300 [Candidatus Zixiibacteriota bacterium]
MGADCFCTGKLGNINCDPLDQVSIGDVTMLIDHLFISGIDAPGLDEADIDGDSSGVIDLADVMLLIEYLYITGEELPDCPPPKDYTAYFWGKVNEGWYFAYHPTTNELDSFYIPGRGRLSVSADGKLGYRPSGGGYARIVALDSIENGDTVPVLANLPLGTVQAASPDGKLLAAIGGVLRIFRTSDYSELYRDSALVGLVFSQNSQRLYGFTRGTYHAFRLDLSNNSYSVTTRQFEGYLVGAIVPSPDETRWYLLLANSVQRVFAVYDVEADSIIFTEYFWPGGGGLAVTPNGDFAFYTNPGDMLWGPGDYDLRIYDASKNTVSRMSMYGIFPDLEDTGGLVDFNCVTPDGRWLVLLCSGYPHAAITVDLGRMSIVHYRRGTQWQEGLACQVAR